MKRYFILLLLNVFVSLPLFSQKDKKEEVIKISNEVKALMDQSLLERKERLDIPIEFKNFMFLPGAMDNLYFIMFFYIRNDALHDQQTEGIISGERGFFFRLYSIDVKGVPKKLVKEVYLPWDGRLEKERYKPDKGHHYSIVLTIPSGNYLLCYSIATPDLKKISIGYKEFNLPDLNKWDEKLGTTTLFFVKNLKILEKPETGSKIVQNYFTYGRLDIEPYFDNVFQGNENVKLFYFVLGASTSSKGTHDFEINFRIKQGDKDVHKFASSLFGRDTHGNG